MNIDDFEFYREGEYLKIKCDFTNEYGVKLDFNFKTKIETQKGNVGYYFKD